MIKFDYNNIRQEIIGFEHGLDINAEFANYAEKINEIIEKIYKIEEINNWTGDDYQSSFMQEIKEYAEMVKGKFENIIVVGLGSPVIGMKAMTQTVLKPYWNSMTQEQRNGFPTVNFVNNIDPDDIQSLATIKDLKKSLVVIVSKDGFEPETMAMYMVMKKKMEDEIGENYRMHIVACTKNESLFHNIAKQEGYKCFVIPYNVIGNFAVMSTCGLLPLVLTGVNIDEMLAGAKDIVKATYNTDIFTNALAQNALIHYLYCIKKNKKVSVLMSYSSRFKEIPVWCSQYKAEMLSKDYDRYENLICAGQIPFSAHGCNEQNALLRMLVEGDNNKIVDIIKTEEFEQDCEIPQIFDYTPIGYLGGKTLSYLLNAEIESMKMVLTDYKRPNVTITIPRITPYYVGQYMAMYMLNMVIQASLYNINPLDISGSENMQNYICAQMGRYGYDETLREMKEKLNRFKKQSVLPE